MSTVMRRYNFKLYPNKAQETALVKQAALLASLWNAALEQRETQWAQECQRKANGERKGISKYDQCREIKNLRTADPAFSAVGSSTMELCIAALDDAFSAFYRRAKQGAGKESGYPRYKSTYAIENKSADCTVWHRDGSGWKFEQSGKHFRLYAFGSGNVRDKSTWMKARGKFPVDLSAVELRDMRLIRVSGEWFASIVVKMEPRIHGGNIATEIKFDLIDKFATAKNRANGECLSGWSDDFQSDDEQNIPQYQQVNQEAPEGTGNLRADDREVMPRASAARPEGTGNLLGDDRNRTALKWPTVPDGTGNSRRIDREQATSELQSEADKRFKKFSWRWKQARRLEAKRRSKDARRHKETLHRLTTQTVRLASDILVICPDIKAATASAKGDERNHGAAVKTVAMLNRHILAQAPAAAIQMLAYKAEEAGIPFARFTPDEHKVSIGRDLPAVTKAARKASRKLKEIAA